MLEVVVLGNVGTLVSIILKALQISLYVHKVVVTIRR